MDKKKRRKITLIIMHFFIISSITVLIIFLTLPSNKETEVLEGLVQLADEPQPLAPETTTEVTTLSPALEVIETSSPTLTVAPTATPTASPTARLTAPPTAAPTAAPTAPPTAAPTPAFTYSVSNDDGVAPAGYTIVFVSVSPAGSYNVKYDGTPMAKSGDRYYLTVKKVADGNYRSHVSVSK